MLKTEIKGGYTGHWASSHRVPSVGAASAACRLWFFGLTVALVCMCVCVCVSFLRAIKFKSEQSILALAAIY